MKTTTKRTAGNCKVLASVRKHMNKPIFQKFSALYNEGGIVPASAFLGLFFNDESRASAIERIVNVPHREELARIAEKLERLAKKA